MTRVAGVGRDAILGATVLRYMGKTIFRNLQSTAVTRRMEAVINAKIIAIGLSAVLVSGCGGSNYKPGVVSAATVKTELPTPTIMDMTEGQLDYRIGPLDKVTVTVFGVNDLTTQGQVDAAGNLSMPLIGQVKAIGETPNGLASKIATALDQKYVRNPQVTVTVTEAVSQLVTVEGSVVKPGSYPVVGSTTLLRVVAQAGGPSEFARLSEAVVFRTVKGERMVARFNLKDIRGARTVDPAIYGNDVIVMGNDSGKQLFKDIISVAPVLGIFYQIARK